jgi:hypothetical protein
VEGVQAVEERVELTPENALEAAAEAVEFVRTKAHLELDYSPESLENLDDVLEDIHKTGQKSHEMGGGITCFGCYLGEVLIRDLGGEWRSREEAGYRETASPIVLAFSNGKAVNPLGKVCKRIDNGAEDSLTSFYRMFKSIVSIDFQQMTERLKHAEAPDSPVSSVSPNDPAKSSLRAVVSDLGGNERTLDWPTTPNEDGQGIALINVMNSPSREATQANYLVNVAAEFKKQGWVPVEFQTVALGSKGLFTIPCALQNGNSFAMVFSHSGLWKRTDFHRFVGWYDKVRACDQTRGVPIFVVSDKDPILLRASGFDGERFGVFFQHMMVQP